MEAGLERVGGGWDAVNTSLAPVIGRHCLDTVVKSFTATVGNELKESS